MNTAARALSDASLNSEGLWTKITSVRFIMAALLIIAVLVSAITVVYMRDLNRRLFIDLASAQAHENYLQTEWTQLLLEQSTWSTQLRVQQVAQQQLAMEMPHPRAIIMVRQSDTLS